MSKIETFLEEYAESIDSTDTDARMFVRACQRVLAALSNKLEKSGSVNAAEFYELSWAATEELNELQEEHDCTICPSLRDAILQEFRRLADDAGVDIDEDEASNPRNW